MFSYKVIIYISYISYIRYIVCFGGARWRMSRLCAMFATWGCFVFFPFQVMAVEVWILFDVVSVVMSLVQFVGLCCCCVFYLR